MGIEGERPAGGEELSEDNRPRIPASEILAKIEMGEPVKYDGVVIEGDLDISKLDLPIENVERTNEQERIGLTEDVKVVKSSIRITNSDILSTVNFNNSIIRGDADFGETSFYKDADFSRSIFSGNADFSGSIFRGDADFSGSTFDWYANFYISAFSGNANFRGSTFSGFADFSRSKFGCDAYFWGSEFSGNADFSGSTFSGNAKFDPCSFNGESLDFRGTRFNRLQDQEFPCRRAKQLAQNLSDKEEADNYYYREMEGRRVRLQEEEVDEWEISFPIQRTIELDTYANISLFNAFKYLRYNLFEAIFVQRIFGYGVRPYQLAAWWLFAVITFALAYWGLKGIHLSGDQITPDNAAVATFREYLYFSIVTSATPGYGGYRPHGVSQWLAGAQAIFGTFMWAAFITTFARKYMR